MYWNLLSSIDSMRSLHGNLQEWPEQWQMPLVSVNFFRIILVPSAYDANALIQFRSSCGWTIHGMSSVSDRLRFYGRNSAGYINQLFIVVSRIPYILYIRIHSLQNPSYRIWICRLRLEWKLYWIRIFHGTNACLSRKWSKPDLSTTQKWTDCTKRVHPLLHFIQYS